MGCLIHGMFNTRFSSIFSSFPYCKTVCLCPSNTVKLYFSSPPLPPPTPQVLRSNAKNPGQNPGMPTMYSKIQLYSLNRLDLQYTVKQIPPQGSLNGICKENSIASLLLLNAFGFNITGFQLFPGVREGLGSSGRLVGTIFIDPATYKWPGSRAMTKNPPGGDLFLPSTVATVLHRKNNLNKSI